MVEDEERAFAAFGIGIAPRTAYRRPPRPERAEPGRDRVCKAFSAEEAGIGEVTLAVECAVVAPP